MNQPWMKFYPADWRADPMLRICSLQARGLWIEMIALMHESEPYGHLLIGGKKPTEKQLASLAGTDIPTLRAALDELREAGVYSLTDDGTVVSRRMVRDNVKADTDKANGKKGGNPKVKGGVNPPVIRQASPPDNGGDKAQMLEARSQSSVAIATGADAPPTETGNPVSPPVDPVKALFDTGVALIVQAGASEKQARSLIGRWRSTTSDGDVMAALMRCREQHITDPIPWLTAALTPRAQRRDSALHLPSTADYEGTL